MWLLVTTSYLIEYAVQVFILQLSRYFNVEPFLWNSLRYIMSTDFLWSSYNQQGILLILCPICTIHSGECRRSTAAKSMEHIKNDYMIMQFDTTETRTGVIVQWFAKHIFQRFQWAFFGLIYHLLLFCVRFLTGNNMFRLFSRDHSFRSFTLYQGRMPGYHPEPNCLLRRKI